MYFYQGYSMMFDKMWALVPVWLNVPEIKKIFKAISGGWDDLYQKLMLLRLMAIAAKSEGKWLELIAKGKLLYRLTGETDEQFRGRVVYAKQFWQEIGTVKGLLKWLEAAGFPAEIDEYVFEQDKLVEGEMLLGQDTLDGLGNLSLSAEVNEDKLFSWAEFEVKVDISQTDFTKNRQKYLIDLINLARRASKLCRIFYFQEIVNFYRDTHFFVFCELIHTPFIQGRFGEYLDGQADLVASPFDTYVWKDSVFDLEYSSDICSRGDVVEYLDDGGSIHFLDNSGTLGEGGLLNGSDNLDGAGTLDYPCLHPGYKFTLNHPEDPLVNQSKIPTIETYIYSE